MDPPPATTEEIAAAVAGQTVVTRFRDTVRSRPGAVALRWREGGEWPQLRWEEYAAQASQLAGALRELGVTHGSRVVLMLRNRPEFHVADIAALLLGAVPVSIYNSSPPEQVLYFVDDCEAVVAIVEDVSLLERFLVARDAMASLTHIVLVDDDASAPAGGTSLGTASFDVVRWRDLFDGNAGVYNKGVHNEVVEQSAATVLPEDLATIIYTSGTTGRPKGVMLDHANITWTIESTRRCLGDLDDPGARIVSYLPMAHIAERMASHYEAITAGYEVTTCPEPGLLGEYLPATRPQLMFGVPRIWERIQARIQSAGDAQQQAVVRAALEVGAEVERHRSNDEPLPATLVARYEEVEPTLALVRELLGLDQLRIAVSGAAKLPVGVLTFFRALGIPLSEAYGLSESSGPIAWAPSRVRLGSVGPPIPGCEVRLADDDEVLCRGGNVFRGYVNNPDPKTLDAEGWLHTGDVGVFDDNGYLRIVDRKKELIVTAGGENLPPAHVEAELKSSPLISQACVVGDDRPFVTALIVLDPDLAPTWARDHGITGESLAAIASDPGVVTEIQRTVDEVNQHLLHDVQIRKFTVLGEEWLPDSDELTPTMKLKRHGIHTKHAAEIEAMYRT